MALWMRCTRRKQHRSDSKVPSKQHRYRRCSLCRCRRRLHRHTATFALVASTWSPSSRGREREREHTMHGMILSSGSESRPFDACSPLVPICFLPCRMDVERFASDPQHLKYRKLLIEMIQDARTILIISLCRDILSKIQDQSRQEFKAESNNDYVWFASSKQYIDRGN